MQIIADLHSHTNVTAHAYSTLTEMVHAAKKMGAGRLLRSPTTARPTRTDRMNGTFPTWI